MFYKSLSELPGKVRKNLPTHGQEIYKEAYNNAWEEYRNPNKRKKGVAREETASKVAWSAVKKIYKKKNNVWTRKQ